MFYKRLSELCSEKKLTVSSLVQALHLSTSKVTAWKNGSIPKGDVLSDIADYLDCSVDYLLERTDFSNDENQRLCVHIEQLFDKTKNPPNPRNISGVELIYFSVKKREYRFTYDVLDQLASYFGTTVENIMNNSELDYEKKLLHDFRSLSREGQDFIIQTLDVAKSKYGSTAPEKDGYEIAAFGGKETKGAPKKTKPEITT